MPAAAQTSRPFRLNGWHVLLMMAAFFGFMFVVNGIFLWAAITSFPGEDENKSYLQGLHYNQTISARHIQEEQGWVSQIGVTPTSSGDRLVIRLLDRDGHALTASSVEAELRRTVTGAADVPLTLQRTPDGHYEADMALLERGVWEARVVATVPYAGEPTHFVSTKKLIVP